MKTAKNNVDSVVIWALVLVALFLIVTLPYWVKGLPK